MITPMSASVNSPAPADRRKLISRIAAAQKEADALKKSAVTAKAALKQAKKDFKQAKKAAKAARKTAKALREELAAMAAPRTAAKKRAKRPAGKKPAAAVPLEPAVATLAESGTPATPVTVFAVENAPAAKSLPDDRGLPSPAG